MYFLICIAIVLLTWQVSFLMHHSAILDFMSDQLSGLEILPCEVSAPHEASDGAKEAMEMRLRALEGQVEETRRGLEEAERIRAAELVLVKGELLTVRGELVTVRGELLTTRGELATVKGELDALKGTLLGPRKEFAEKRECLQAKLALEEEMKELRKGVSLDEAAAMPCPTPKHVEFDVEEELRMRQGIHRMVWQRFHATTILDLTGLPYLSDAILGHVSTMTHLKRITLDGLTPFSPEGIKHLYMKQLESLELTSHAITDSCLEGIGAARSLKSLYLNGTRVTDAGLQHLAPLSRLQVLVLPSMITDTGLEHIQCLTALEGLDISNSIVTEKGVALLKGLPRLRQIRAEGRGLHALVLSNLPGVELVSVALSDMN
ncbi:unnamed protein product [Closterium sp. Yama58-4]|nr:unnamed protein product [Closterium sp. Yama58-4]